MVELKWNALFGEDFYFKITNDERRYLGLNNMESDWEVTQYYSKVNLWHKRTSVFFCGDFVKKVIIEEKRVSEGEITYESITEYDTELRTENREWLIPLTSRGKKKKVNASNILAVRPFGCGFHFHLDTAQNTTVSMSIYNSRNDKEIAIGEWDRINKIRNDADFHDFMKYYMETCPPDYFDRIKLMRESKHLTVKYKTGDVFRIEIDRFRYGYGIITGRLKEIRKWKELPEHHSLRKLMMVPIMVRYYDIYTTNKNLSVDELSGIPLSRVEICGDNDIIWGTHTIIGHKDLQENDIEFNLVCTKIQEFSEHTTVHTYDFLVSDGIIDFPEKFNLYVEWGMAATILPFERISEKLREYLQEYRSPHGGVSVGVGSLLHSMVWHGESEYSYKYNLLNDINKNMRAELFHCLGLDADADFDDFAKKFGGLTKEEILKRNL